MLSCLVCARYFVHTKIPRAELGSNKSAPLSVSAAHVNCEHRRQADCAGGFAGEGRHVLVEEEALNVGKEALCFLFNQGGR